jgi:pimeloyl-ACP methyl ester carboxylesterase
VAGANYLIETSHAAIAVTESEGLGLPALLIHGNSCCKEVFANQLGGEIGRRHRLIALDLPGHGRSSNARNPRRSYTMPGYADLVAEVADRLGLTRFAVLGWSLGGHIGIELFTRCEAMTGLMITGTPPVASTPEAVAAGFRPTEHMGLTGKRDFTDVDALTYAAATLGAQAPKPDFLVDAVRRTDGRARETLFTAVMAGWGADQRHIVETYDRPLAVVQGGADAMVNVDYLHEVSYAKLWDGKVHVLDGVEHAPFWEAPARFDPLFARFLAEVA